MIEQQYRLRFFGVLFALAAGYMILVSESGIVERIALGEKRQALAGRIDDLKVEQRRLSGLLSRYREGFQAPVDLHRMGMIERGGTAVFVRGMEAEKAPAESVIAPEGMALLPVLRIVWLVFSAAVIGVMVYFFRKPPVPDRDTIGEG